METIKVSTTDPGIGRFRKGEHKHVFAYGIETVCDKMNGFLILQLIQEEHDIRTFKGLYNKLRIMGWNTV